MTINNYVIFQSKLFKMPSSCILYLELKQDYYFCKLHLTSRLLFLFDSHCKYYNACSHVFFTPFQYLLDTPLSVTAFTQYPRACRNADRLHRPMKSRGHW